MEGMGAPSGRDGSAQWKGWERPVEGMGAPSGRDGSAQWILMGASNGRVTGFYLQHALFFPE
jgi:hypothetical protein